MFVVRAQKHIEGIGWQAHHGIRATGESPIFPSEICVSDGEQEEESLPIALRSDMLRRSQKLQQGDKDLEIFCLEQELEAIKEENIKLKLTTKSQQESISVLSHKIHQLETAKSQGEKWFGGNEQFSYVAKRGIQALFGSSEPSQPSPKKNRQLSP